MERTDSLTCLDGLRAVAVIQVILFHHRLESESAAARSGLYRLLSPTRFGFSGVHLFLVLSGFCLTHSLIRRARSGRSPTLVAFLKARWWRIAPPYLAAMALYLGAILASGWAGHADRHVGDVNLRQVVAHATFLHGLADDTLEGISPPFWSLSLEFQFYLTLPLLFVLAGRFGPIRTLLGVAAVGLAWRLAIARLAPGSGALQSGFFVGRWAEFALGMAAAYFYNHPERPRSWFWRPSRSGGLAVASLSAAVALSAGGLTLGQDLAFGIGYAALLVAVLGSAESGGLLGRLASIAPLARVGTISYSLYLTHSLVLDREYAVYRRIVPRPNLGTDLALFAATLAAVFAVGWAFHRLVERRFLRSVDVRPAPRVEPEAATLVKRPARPIGRLVLVQAEP